MSKLKKFILGVAFATLLSLGTVVYTDSANETPNEKVTVAETTIQSDPGGGGWKAASISSPIVPYSNDPGGGGW